MPRLFLIKLLGVSLELYQRESPMPVAFYDLGEILRWI